ncbi:hypothetical protein ADUPG1_012159, partial [Aduncisulcus paluster]
MYWSTITSMTKRSLLRDALNSTISQSSSDPELLYLRVLTAIDVGNYDSAHLILTNIIKQPHIYQEFSAERKSALAVLQARVLLAKKAPQHAAKWLGKALAFDPTNVEAADMLYSSGLVTEREFLLLLEGVQRLMSEDEQWLPLLVLYGLANPWKGVRVDERDWDDDSTPPIADISHSVGHPVSVDPAKHTPLGIEDKSLLIEPSPALSSFSSSTSSSPSCSPSSSYLSSPSSPVFIPSSTSCDNVYMSAIKTSRALVAQSLMDRNPQLHHQQLGPQRHPDMPMATSIVRYHSIPSSRTGNVLKKSKRVDIMGKDLVHSGPRPLHRKQPAALKRNGIIDIVKRERTVPMGDISGMKPPGPDLEYLNTPFPQRRIITSSGSSSASSGSSLASIPPPGSGVTVPLSSSLPYKTPSIHTVHSSTDKHDHVIGGHCDSIHCDSTGHSDEVEEDKPLQNSPGVGLDSSSSLSHKTIGRKDQNANECRRTRRSDQFSLVHDCDDPCQQNGLREKEHHTSSVGSKASSLNVIVSKDVVFIHHDTIPIPACLIPFRNSERFFLKAINTRLHTMCDPLTASSIASEALQTFTSHSISIQHSLALSFSLLSSNTHLHSISGSLRNTYPSHPLTHTLS